MNTSEFIAKIAAYVQKYAPQYGILVHSPIIAQAILESGRGTSELATNANNYFGLKYRKGRCPTSTGVYVKQGSEQNPDGSYASSVMQWCIFPDMEAGVQGYFDFINNSSRYDNLKGVTDPETYLKLIREDGYATSLKYVENLLNVIESYDLTKYDVKTQEEKRMHKVCIDAGHYDKYNRSPGVPEYYESEIVWKLHLLQKKYLEALGIEVITTRSDQKKDLALQSRGKKAKGCELFISNHTNAVGGGMNEKIDHVAVYHLVNDTTTNADDISAEIAKLIAPVIAECMGTKQGFKVVTRQSNNDRNNDGLMNDNYYGVLHGARLVNVPGLILEHSFHTNTNAVKWLLNDANLDKLAKAEAECIAAYLKRGENAGNGAETGEKAENEEKHVEEVSTPYLAKITAENTDVRAAAGSKYKKKTTVKRGEVFTIVAVLDGWGKLKSGAGWIWLADTEKMEDAKKEDPKESASAFPYLVKIAADVLNVRAGAGLTYKVNTTVKRGEVYTIVDECEGWGKLKSGAGWISLKYTERH